MSDNGDRLSHIGSALRYSNNPLHTQLVTGLHPVCTAARSLALQRLHTLHLHRCGNSSSSDRRASSSRYTSNHGRTIDSGRLAPSLRLASNIRTLVVHADQLQALSEQLSADEATCGSQAAPAGGCGSEQQQPQQQPWAPPCAPAGVEVHPSMPPPATPAVVGGQWPQLRCVEVVGSHPTGLHHLMPLLEQLSPEEHLQQVVLRGPGPVAEMDTAQAMRTVSDTFRDRVKAVDTVHSRPQQGPAHGAVSDNRSISSSGRHSSSSSSSSSSRDGEGWQLKVRGYQQTPELIEQLPPLTGQALDLVVVDLAGNRLTSLPLNLHQLTRLTSLDIGHNQLTAAAVGPTMSRLVHLKHLSLRTNRLDTLPASLLRLTGLEALDVSHNPLDWGSLTVILGKLTSLRVLRASACGCEELPEEVCQLSRLEQLHLSSNQLQALPRGVAHMPALEVVNLAGNHLHHFTRHGAAGTVATWPRLRSLDLSDQYVGLSRASGLTECTALEVLRLGGNRLSTLPAGVSRLERLQVLALDGNPLGGGLPALPRQLKQLTLRGCRLRGSGELDSDVDWVSLGGLTLLDLSSVRVTALPSLPPMHMLRELHLAHMDIRSLGGLGRLPHLEKLNLAHTCLTEFDLSCLGSLQQLRGLTLFKCLREGAQLEALAKLGPLPHLHHLNIGHNKLQEAPPQFWKWVRQQPALVELDLSGNCWEGNWGVPSGDPSPLPRQLTWLSLAEGCINALPVWLVAAGSHLQVMLMHGTTSDDFLSRINMWGNLRCMMNRGLQQLSPPEVLGQHTRFRGVDLVQSRLVWPAVQAWRDSPVSH